MAGERGDDVQIGAAGVLTRGEAEPVARDSVFRISSMTKPIVAVAALILVEECRLRLDDPVDDLLPELADRRVLVDPLGPIDGETVPARRPITVHDVLTFRARPRHGLRRRRGRSRCSRRWTTSGSAPAAGAAARRPSPTSGSRKLGTLPLLHQPGERWLYNTGADVLGVLDRARRGPAVRRRSSASASSSRSACVDTGVRDRPTSTRLGSCYASGSGDRRAPVVFDPPDGQWATPPAFPSGGGGLVSTVDDFHAFGRMLLARRPPARRRRGCSRGARSRR